MSYDIRYLPLAEEDIETLAVYLSHFYAGTAGYVMNEMETRTDGLREHPQMYEEYEDGFSGRLRYSPGDAVITPDGETSYSYRVTDVREYSNRCWALPPTNTSPNTNLSSEPRGPDSMT